MSTLPPDEQSTLTPLSPVAPQIPAAPQKKSRRGLCIVLSLVGVGACMLCVVACVALSGTALFRVFLERGKVEKRIDTFMQAMADKNTSLAYSMFSARAQQTQSQADLDKMVQGSDYVLFEGYQGVSVTSIHIQMNANIGTSRTTTATTSGTISYEGGFKGNFTATLERHGGEWQIYTINITVPPEKVK